MEKLRFVYHGMTHNDSHRLSFIGTEFDAVIFSIANFEFGENIPDTEDALVYFNYRIIKDDSINPVEGARLDKFLALLSRLVDQIIRDAVKDL